MMRGILVNRPLDPSKGTDYSRMDSAFCTDEMIQLCLLRKVKATITAHGRIGWEKEALNITKWIPWEFTEEEKQRSLLQQKPLPKIELGFYMYQPGFADNIRLPVVIKRTNSAYALLGLIAHNFFRFISILDNPEAPQFAKALRRKFVHLPGKFLIECKQRVIRMSQDSYKEVMKLKMRWAEIFNPPQKASNFYDKKAYRKSSLTTFNSG
jgi:hypothetical protein